jgi:hypothetical protein
MIHDLVTSFLVAFARGDRLRATQPNVGVLLRADAMRGRVFDYGSSSDATHRFSFQRDHGSAYARARRGRYSDME